MVSVALGGLSASLWAEMLAMKQHLHGNMKSLKGHSSQAEGGWILFGAKRGKIHFLGLTVSVNEVELGCMWAEKLSRRMQGKNR